VSIEKDLTKTFMSNPAEQRLYKRSTFSSSAKLLLDNGVILEGVTRDVSFGGAYIFTDVDIEQIRTGDKGVFTFLISQDSQQLSTEFPCRVVHFTEIGVGLEFVNDEFSPNTPVFVRRSNGELQGGWKIASPEQLVPDSVKAVVSKKEQKGPCVICTRMSENNAVSYKVYTIQELKEIQEKGS
jgi:hypothetical protein